MQTCLIVGAGITGLSAARHLKKKGWQVTVLEKAPRAGGRMATRVIDKTVFDYGAQFLTTYSLPFRAMFEDWLDENLVDEWCRGFLSVDRNLTYDGYARYRARQGMNSIAQFLAQDIDLRCDTTVSQIQLQASQWVVQTAQQTFAADAVLLTAPVPQARKLLSPALRLDESVYEAFEQIKYVPCIAMMAVTAGESGIPEPGAIQMQGEPLIWISDNSQKNMDPEQHGLTIHTGKLFSKQYWKTEPEALIPLIWELVRPHVQCELVTAQVHRWLYSRTFAKHPQSYLQAYVQPPLLFAGDGFGDRPESTIESAAISGLAAAKHLVKVCS